MGRGSMEDKDKNTHQFIHPSIFSPITLCFPPSFSCPFFFPSICHPTIHLSIFNLLFHYFSIDPSFFLLFFHPPFYHESVPLCFSPLFITPFLYPSLTNVSIHPSISRFFFGSLHPPSLHLSFQPSSILPSTRLPLHLFLGGFSTILLVRPPILASTIA